MNKDRFAEITKEVVLESFGGELETHAMMRDTIEQLIKKIVNKYISSSSIELERQRKLRGIAGRSL